MVVLGSVIKLHAATRQALAALLYLQGFQVLCLTGLVFSQLQQLLGHSTVVASKLLRRP